MNIKKIITTTTVLFVSMTLLLSATIGSAKSRPRKGPSTDEFFKRFDTDSDEKLSLEEFPGPDDQFSQFDQNEDGYIEKDEMPNVPPPPNRKNDRNGRNHSED